MTSTFI